MIRRVLAFGALTAVLATPAFAQSPPTAQPKTDKMQQHQSMPTGNSSMDKGSVRQGSTATTDGSAAKDNKAAMGKDAGTAKSTADATMNAEKRPGFLQTQSANEWRASKLIGTSVIGADNKSIGDINELILGEQGEIKAVVIGVGGFLGMGEKNVAVPFEALDVQRKAKSGAIEKITVAYSKDELKNAPKFAYYDGQKSKATTTGMSSADAPPPGNAYPPRNHPATK